MEIGGARIEGVGARLAPTGETPAETIGAALSWLASGVRELEWVLRSIVPSHLSEVPPVDRGETLGDWSAARHVRHLALYETLRGLPVVRAAAIGSTPGAEPFELQGRDAAWDVRSADETAVRRWVYDLGSARHEMLALAETADDEAWVERANRPGLAQLIARSRQHELDHLRSLWGLALDWDTPSLPTGHAPSGLPLQAPDQRVRAHS